MSQQLKCPACAKPIAVSELSSGGESQCPLCGAKLRLKSKAKQDAEAAPEPVADIAPIPFAAADAYPAAAESLSPAPEGTERPPRPRRKGRKKRTEIANPLAQLGTRRIAGGIGFSILVLGIVLVSLKMFGGGAKETATPAGFVVVDQPDPTVAAAKIDEPVPAFLQAPTAQQEPNAPRPPRPAPPALPEEQKPRWHVPPDAKPETASTKYTAGWGIFLDRCVLVYTHAIDCLPLLADMNGPFALFLPAWQKAPRGVSTELKNQKVASTLVEFPQPPIPVTDLRTGKPGGEFDWKVPFWRDARLSPDGMYLVGPDSVPERLKAPEENVLFVWKQRMDKPLSKLTVPAPVVWLEFIAPDRLAVETCAPKPALQIWDVVKGTVLKTIPLTAAQFPSPRSSSRGPDDKRVQLFYRPVPTRGAVSPGGHYVALAGKTGITLVSVDEGREIGTLALLPRPADAAVSYRGISFSRDGSELLAAFTVTGRPGTVVRSWSVATGNSLTDVQFEGAGYGAPIAGSEPGTVILPGGLATDLGNDAALAELRPSTLLSPYAEAVVIDTFTGTTLLNLGYGILRWTDSGPLVALGPIKNGPADLPQRYVERNWASYKPEVRADLVKQVRAGERDARILAVYSIDFNREKHRELAALGVKNLRPRPAVTRADRSAVQAIVPAPPATWAAPPAATQVSPPPDATILPDPLVAFADRHAAVIRQEAKTVPRYRSEMYWDRYDLQSGQPLGEPILLWPWVTNPNPLKSEPGPNPSPPTAARPAAGPSGQPSRIPKGPVVALSPDGERLALCDPGTPGRVDVWTSAGERVLGFFPFGPGYPAQWLGWTPDRRLLTLVDGALTAWEVPAGKAVYEVDGGYSVPVEAAPGRAWLAVSAGTHIDLLDTSTGQCLGRCRAGAVSGRIMDLALSPDGRRLAALVPGPTGGQKGSFTAVIWDLSDGKATLVSSGTPPYGAIHWGGPEQLVLCTESCQLFDLRARDCVAVYAFPARYDRPAEPLKRSPDGRLWLSLPTPHLSKLKSPRFWKAFTVPDAQQGRDVGVLADSREYLITAKLPIRVEVNVGEATQSRTMAEKVARLLQEKGFTIGPKGWALRVSHEIGNSGSLLQRSASDHKGINIPAVHFQWLLLDSDGTAVWKANTLGQFATTASKYHTGRKHGAFAGMEVPGAITVDHYDFGNRDMRTAISEEIIERQAANPSLPNGLPKWLLKAPDGYHQLPLTLELVRSTSP